MTKPQAKYFLGGVEDFDSGYSLDDVHDYVNSIRRMIGSLESMAYYDGYLRRKYGLVDSEGYET